MSRITFPDGSTGWLVTSYRLSRAVLSDTRFSNRHALRTSSTKRAADLEVAGGNLYALDPPEHTRYRELLGTVFTPRHMTGMTARIEEIVRDCLDTMARLGPPVDLVTAFAMPIPTLITSELLGIPYAERATFQHHVVRMLRADASPEESYAAVLGLQHELEELVVAEPNHLADGLLRRLVDLEQLGSGEIAMLGTVMLVSGFSATVSMFALGVYALLRNPSQLDLLHTEPQRMGGAIDELLRYATVTQHGTVRRAAQDCELAGERIHTDELVLISLPAANRDSAQFPEPAVLDVTRPPGRHLSFGYGPHLCPAQTLVRLQMGIAYRALFTRFPSLRLDVPADQIVVHEDMSVLGLRELPVRW